MHHHHKPDLHIGEENSHLSSEDATLIPLPQNQKQSQTHFSIQVSPSSPHPPPPNSPNTPCHHDRFSNNPSEISPRKRIPVMALPCCLFPTPFGAKFPTSKLLPRFRFLMFLPLPSLYFLFSNPSPLDFFSVIACSAALLISLNLALLLFTRLFPAKFSSSSSSSSSSSTHPVVWSIGSNPKQVKSTSWGCWVQVYSNGDVYEGEFQKGKCWGSGVYHYHMSGRYEGDWVDGKYDGYGVETWARGSRYRGQYREGLRHGMGIYRFYSGDVYGGEWSNGQCHGFGVHTCYDGCRRYVGGSNGVSNMDMDSNISEMGTNTLNILPTRCTVTIPNLKIVYFKSNYLELRILHSL